jgi:GntR family transcriptional regulator
MTDTAIPKPKYMLVFDDLSERIRSGVFPVGSTLPTEKELCAEFGISRYTVREALRRLAERGIVERRQGSGSQVVAESGPQVYAHRMQSISELHQYASLTKLDNIDSKMVVVDDDIAEILGRPPGCQWLQVDALRRNPQGRALNYTRIFINEAFRGIAPELGDLVGPHYDLIEARFGVSVSEVVQTISAEVFPEDVSRALGRSRKSWSVLATRRYLAIDDMPIQTSFNWTPADEFSYVMHLKRDE